MHALSAHVAKIESGPVEVRSHLAGLTRVDPGWGFVDRRLDEHLLYLVVAGSYRSRLAGRRCTHAPGGLLWLPPGTRHTVVAGPGPAPTLFHLRYRAWNGERELRLPRPVVLGDCGHLRPVCELWLTEHRRGEHRRPARFRACLQLLAGDVLECMGREGAGPGQLSLARRRRLEAAVREHPGRAWTSTDLADLVGLSRAYFTRLFTRSYGRPPRAWLLRERLDQARVLLQTTNLRVGAVAARLGYRSQQLFSRQYRARFGLPPGRDR